MRDLSPSTTRTWTFTRSPGRKAGTSFFRPAASIVRITFMTSLDGARCAPTLISIGFNSSGRFSRVARTLASSRQRAIAP
jgi:hypothetical protein